MSRPSPKDRVAAEQFVREEYDAKPENWNTHDDRPGLVRKVAVAMMQKRQHREWHDAHTD